MLARLMSWTATGRFHSCSTLQSSAGGRYGVANMSPKPYRLQASENDGADAGKAEPISNAPVEEESLQEAQDAAAQANASREAVVSLVSRVSFVTLPVLLVWDCHSSLLALMAHSRHARVPPM